MEIMWFPSLDLFRVYDIFNNFDFFVQILQSLIVTKNL